MSGAAPDAGPAARSAAPSAIVVLGPTGSGKSAFALRLARQLPVEILSVDSAQVYRGLDVGTAKPTPAEQAQVRHHLIDLIEPEQVYSAGQFRDDMQRLLPQVRARGRIPLLVGGTMLYYRTLFHGLASLPPADPVLRAHIDARAAREGWPALHVQLARTDPQGAQRIHPHDSQRIQRALEVLALSGRPLAEHWSGQERIEDFSTWQFVILEPLDRAVLHQRLEVRLQEMLGQGLVEEVRALLARGTLHADSPVLRLVGYRQLVPYCRGEVALTGASAAALAATRQLAKRQLTWLRSATLLPERAMTVKIDANDGAARERLAAALIQRCSTP